MSGKQGDEGVMIHIHPMAKLFKRRGSRVKEERRKVFSEALRKVSE